MSHMWSYRPGVLVDFEVVAIRPDGRAEQVKVRQDKAPAFAWLGAAPAWAITPPAQPIRSST